MHVIYLPVGHGKFTQVDSDCGPEVLQHGWSLGSPTSTGQRYAVRKSRKCEGLSQSHVRLSAVVAGSKSPQMVDHINGDALDNRRQNLRLCVSAQNQRNRQKTPLPTSSRYKGVSRTKRERGKWAAHIEKGGKKTHLGVFGDETDAARAYDAAAREFFGEFARCNFPA